MEEKNYLHNLNKNDHRLKKHNQFNFIYRKGEKFSSKNFVLFVVKSKFNNYKIGYSISKKIGKAWKRNKLRRRIKEIIRLNSLPKYGFNYVLQAKIGAGELDYHEIERQLMSIFNEVNRLDK